MIILLHDGMIMDAFSHHDQALIMSVPGAVEFVLRNPNQKALGAGARCSLL